jgi:hypothetical protein
VKLIGGFERIGRGISVGDDDAVGRGVLKGSRVMAGVFLKGTVPVGVTVSIACILTLGSCRVQDSITITTNNRESK